MEQRDVLAVFVTYHPDEVFPERVQSVLPQVDQVLVVDNASGPDARSMLAELAEHPRILLQLNEENEGLGRPYNDAFALAQRQGYGWVLTFDQDTMVLPHLMENFQSVYQRHPTPERIGVIGANYRDPVTGRLWVQDRTIEGLPRSLGTGEWIETPVVINSGSLFSVEAYQAAGPFRNDFFVDRVDLEYCYRVTQAGYLVLAANRVGMEHPVGAQRRHWFLGKYVNVTHHSAIRRYYITRNHLLYAATYGRKDPLRAVRETYYELKELAKLVLYEDDRSRKLLAVGCGIWHAVSGRRGRLSPGLERFLGKTR